jgi:hypothetical protein
LLDPDSVTVFLSTLASTSGSSITSGLAFSCSLVNQNDNTSTLKPLSETYQTSKSQ